MTTVFLAWQDPESRRWWPIGRLQSRAGMFQFVYTLGAKNAPNFTPLAMFPELESVYESNVLFPLFANRLLPKNRPEYADFVECLNVPQSEHDPVVLLARSGGLRATDSLEIFPCPEPLSSGEFRVNFFARGISHLPQTVVAEQINSLGAGDRLFLMLDVQNPHDEFALAIRMPEPAIIVGYCPRYLTMDLYEVLNQCPDSPSVRVERVNPHAPFQLRLLCSLTGCWPAGFVPCSDESYKPIVAELQSVTSNGG